MVNIGISFRSILPVITRVNGQLCYQDMVNGVSAAGLGTQDLNIDSVLNTQDIGEWLAMTAEDKGHVTPCRSGETNSVGSTFPAVRSVSLFDFNVLSDFFDPTGKYGPYLWSEGNFDGDSGIDLSG